MHHNTQKKWERREQAWIETIKEKDTKIAELEAKSRADTEAVDAALDQRDAAQATLQAVRTEFESATHAEGCPKEMIGGACYCWKKDMKDVLYAV